MAETDEEHSDICVRRCGMALGRVLFGRGCRGYLPTGEWGHTQTSSAYTYVVVILNYVCYLVFTGG